MISMQLWGIGHSVPCSSRMRLHLALTCHANIHARDKSAACGVRPRFEPSCSSESLKLAARRLGSYVALTIRSELRSFARLYGVLPRAQSRSGAFWSRRCRARLDITKIPGFSAAKPCATYCLPSVLPPAWWPRVVRALHFRMPPNGSSISSHGLLSGATARGSGLLTVL